MTTIATVPLSISADAKDAALNLSGNRLAIVANEGTVSVFKKACQGGLWSLCCTWKSSGSGLSKVAWAPPVWGSMLATAGDTGHVNVWRESVKDSISAWQLAGGPAQQTGAVTALSFAPPAMALQLAAAFADGHVRIYGTPAGCAGASWQQLSQFAVSTVAASCLSWQPAGQPCLPLILVGTADRAQVWTHHAAWGTWTCAATVQADGPVSSVHWAPNLGQPKELVAVASNKRVSLYTLAGPANSLEVEHVAILDHAAPVTRVQWNAWGTWLAAATEDCQVQQWRPNLGGEWTLQGRLVGTCGSEQAGSRPATDSMLLVD